jgi:hypothetical protein
MIHDLSFYQQNNTGIDLLNLIDKYNKLYSIVESDGNFKL